MSGFDLRQGQVAVERHRLVPPRRHRSPAQLATGYQPAVIKVLSYAHGTVRATKTGQYAQREDEGRLGRRMKGLERENGLGGGGQGAVGRARPLG
jgi:hypothetical protein